MNVINWILNNKINYQLEMLFGSDYKENNKSKR